MNVDHARTGLRLNARPGGTWLAPAAILVGSCLLYLVNLDRAPLADELYHILAARGLLEHGEPRIAEGLYTRVFAYTWLVGRMFALFGESLAAARLPSVLAMAAVNALLFAWLRKESGWRAAALATGLLAISPFALETAQFARFYALQSLVFLAGCLAVYEIVQGSRPIVGRSVGRGLIAAGCFALAVYLQPTTLLGLAGLGLWLGTVIIVPWLTTPAVALRHKLLALVVSLAAFALVALSFLLTGLAAKLWELYRWAPVWDAAHADEFWHYHVFYVLFYPSLWPVVGLLSLAALAAWPRVAWFAMVVFAIGFLLNSFAGAKGMRYLAYAQPFLFILLGLGSAALLPRLRRAVAACGRRLEAHLAGVGLAGWHLPDILIWSSVAFVILANAAFLRTVTLLADITVPPDQPTVQWQAARPAIERLLGEVDVVVTMAELETLYFWDRYDILFSPSRLTEMDDQREFAADHRTGRPVITTTESLRRVVECTASGLFISNTHRWRLPNLIDAATVDFIERSMTRLDLPASTQLVVFAWSHRPSIAAPSIAAPSIAADDCSSIAEVIRGPRP